MSAYEKRVKKQEDDGDIHFVFGRLLPDSKPLGSGRRLSPQERLQNRNRWIDDAEREISLIRQGIGKWPESTVECRMEGLLEMGGFYLNLNVPEVNSGTREQRLEYVERRLKSYREEVNETTGLYAVSSAAMQRGAYSQCFLMAAVWCVILAIVDFDGIWIYDLSKWALCGICAFLGFQTWREGSRRHLIVLGIIAVIYNPFAPIRFGDGWKVVNALAGATFLGLFLWDAAWIEKAWNNRKKIGTYAFMGALACFGVSILAGTYHDSKSGGPERRAADLKVKREQADAVARERLMKSLGEKKAPKEEPRKYPRALPGGGLDWTGVPGGPRE